MRAGLRMLTGTPWWWWAGRAWQWCRLQGVLAGIWLSGPGHWGPEPISACWGRVGVVGRLLVPLGAVPSRFVQVLGPVVGFFSKSSMTWSQKWGCEKKVGG